MGVFRIHKENRYTAIDNRILQSDTLSIKAIGLLCKMLSYPEDFNLTLTYLVGASKDGRAAIESALDELEEAGYVIRSQNRDERGRFKGWNYDVFESPQALVNTEVSPDAGNPHTVNPQSENPQLQNNIYKNNINIMDVCTAEPSPQKEIKSFGEIINEHIQDEKLKAALWEYIKMRIRKKNPLTNYALILLLESLNERTADANAQLKMVNTAIMGGYNTFTYVPEKQKGKKQPSFNNFSQREYDYELLEKKLLGF